MTLLSGIEIDILFLDQELAKVKHLCPKASSKTAHMEYMAI